MMEIFCTVTKLKEKNEKVVIYYYDINTIDIDYETAGVLQIDLDLFNHLPKNFNGDSSIFSLHEAKNKRIKTLKVCPDSPKRVVFDVDLDGGAFHAATDIILYYQKEKQIPETTLTTNPSIMKRLMKEKNVKEVMLANGTSEEDFNNLLNILGVNSIEDD